MVDSSLINHIFAHENKSDVYENNCACIIITFGDANRSLQDRERATNNSDQNSRQ